MGLKKFIFGDPETQGMIYRIRVFDHGHHVKTATVPNRGQNRIDLVVKGKDYGFLGTEVKLAFMINPDIPPHYFGNIMEIDYDVRDATQLGDLIDLCPDLVSNLNKQYYDTVMALRSANTNVLKAEFTEKAETERKETIEETCNSLISVLTDPVPEPQENPSDNLTDIEKQVEQIPGVKEITKALDRLVEVPHSISANATAIREYYKIDTTPEYEKQEKILKLLKFCQQPGNQKCLRWLPKYLHVEPEISALISQTELDGVGVIPLYYIKQSTAEISEKMLQRPKVAEDWKTTLIYGAIAISIILIVVFCILKLAGAV